METDAVMEATTNSRSNTDKAKSQIPKLQPHHLADLQSSGLNTETIESLGFHSGTAAEVKAILGFDAGPGLIIPYPCYEGQPFYRVKPDKSPIVDGKPLGKYLQATGSKMRAYIPPKTWEALVPPIIWETGNKDQLLATLVHKQADLVRLQKQLTGNSYWDWHTLNGIRVLEDHIGAIERWLREMEGKH